MTEPLTEAGRHADDGYGQCTICREYVPHTDDEVMSVPFPCAVVRLDAERERMKGLDVDRLAQALFTAMGWPTRKRAPQPGSWNNIEPLSPGLVSGDADNPEWAKLAVAVAAAYGEAHDDQ